MPFSRAERETIPARYSGLDSARELDLEMIVLSRSKKAASMSGAMVGQDRGPAKAPDGRPDWCQDSSKGPVTSHVAPDEKKVSQNRDPGCLPASDGGTLRRGADPRTSPPAPFPRLLHTPP